MASRNGESRRLLYRVACARWRRSDSGGSLRRSWSVNHSWLVVWQKVQHHWCPRRGAPRSCLCRTEKVQLAKRLTVRSASASRRTFFMDLWALIAFVTCRESNLKVAVTKLAVGHRTRGSISLGCVAKNNQKSSRSHQDSPREITFQQYVQSTRGYIWGATWSLVRDKACATILSKSPEANCDAHNLQPHLPRGTWHLALESRSTAWNADTATSNGVAQKLLRLRANVGTITIYDCVSESESVRFAWKNKRTVDTIMRSKLTSSHDFLTKVWSSVQQLANWNRGCEPAILHIPISSATI